MAGDTLRIGICDDEKEDLLRIEEAVRTSINKHSCYHRMPFVWNRKRHVRSQPTGVL